ncbi:hypothetical protein Y032_0003g1376 [Ancylostoma ceylanicum]|uniref:Uncharacterized protein n=1 Tax=Ancylostoma ceylanicum TaxID=53326 RepID=A0A016VZA4_9BILA|nr:hypothetical protein Y032_0003g1376 [Ancylostoma ceylanicum]
MATINDDIIAACCWSSSLTVIEKLCQLYITADDVLYTDVLKYSDVLLQTRITQCETPEEILPSFTPEVLFWNTVGSDKDREWVEQSTSLSRNFQRGVEHITNSTSSVPQECAELLVLGLNFTCP